MKYIGKIGFYVNENFEVSPGIYDTKIVEKVYTGDILKTTKKFQDHENYQNGELVLTNRISILADLYMKNHMSSIKYITFNGSSEKWKVNTVEILEYPRVLLTIGGLYNA